MSRRRSMDRATRSRIRLLTPMPTSLTQRHAVIIGAGHNGLVTAFYLARSGWKVSLLESRDAIGGACVSERLDCGCIFSTGANHFGMLRPEIIRDMRLFDRGLKVLIPDPQMVVSLDDRRTISIYRNSEKTKREIARYSPRDAANFIQYVRDLELAAAALKPMLLSRNGTIEDLARALDKVQSSFSKRFLYGSVAELVQHYFDSEPVRTAMAATSILYKASPWAKGTGFALLYLAQYAVREEQGWGLVIGGMGQVTSYLTEAVTELGVEIKTRSPVKRVLVDKKNAVGVELENGNFLPADVVFSNADQYTTFTKLLPPDCLSIEEKNTLQSRDFDGACSKLNLRLDSSPSFGSLADDRAKEARQTLTVISPNLYQLHELYQECADGQANCGSYLEVLCPSELDSTISCGRHSTVSVFTIYTPYHLSSGDWHTQGPHCQTSLVSSLERLSPGLASSISWTQFLSPVDIEKRFGMHQGNVDHGNMQLDNLFSCRPLPRTRKSTNRIENFYLCGAGAHPGGLVSGATGYNAAIEALENHGGLSA